MRLCLSLVAATVLGLLAGEVEASISYTTVGGSVSQNFDAILISTGTNASWANNNAGWYSNRTTYTAGNGSSNAGGLYSFGTTAERALGSIGSGSANPVLFGLLLTNNTGVTLDSFDVTYVGEQWRVGGANAVANTLAFSYQTGTILTLTGGTYTNISSLDFTGPTASGPVASGGGNATANQVTISGTASGIDWNPGEQLFLRWTDVNDDDADHGLAIDDFTFSANVASTGVVPEPAALVVWGGIGLLGVGLAVHKMKIA